MMLDSTHTEVEDNIVLLQFPGWVTLIGGAAVVAVVSISLAAYQYGTEKLLWN